MSLRVHLSRPARVPARQSTPAAARFLTWFRRPFPGLLGLVGGLVWRRHARVSRPGPVPRGGRLRSHLTRGSVLAFRVLTVGRPCRFLLSLLVRGLGGAGVRFWVCWPAGHGLRSGTVGQQWWVEPWRAFFAASRLSAAVLSIGLPRRPVLAYSSAALKLR